MVVYESQARLSSKKSEFRMEETQREVNRSHSIARLCSEIFAFYFRLNDSHKVSHRRNDIFTRLCHSVADECTLDRRQNETRKVSCVSAARTQFGNVMSSWQLGIASRNATRFDLFSRACLRSCLADYERRASIFSSSMFLGHICLAFFGPVKFACARAETILDTFGRSRRRQIK